MKRYIKNSQDHTYKNRRNENKFIETRKYNDGHTVARQYMEWDTPEGKVKNYYGSKTNKGRYRRANKHTLDMMLEDYDMISENSDVMASSSIQDISKHDDNLWKYLCIFDSDPEGYNEYHTSWVDYDNGTAYFFKDNDDEYWTLVIGDDDLWNPDTDEWNHDKFWGDEELINYNDVKLTRDELYSELSKLPGHNFNNFYGMRSVFNDMERF